MTSFPLISICITTKGIERKEYLKECTNSILAQSYTNYEICINDNNLVDVGMAMGFQKALEKAKGDFVLMLSDDDLLHSWGLKTLVDMIESYPGYGCYFGSTDMLQEDAQIASLTCHRVGLNGTVTNGYNIDQIDIVKADEAQQKIMSGRMGMYVFWSSGIVKREIALKVGAFPDYGTSLMGDYHYTIGCSSHQGMVITNKSICAQRVHKLNHGRAASCVGLFIVNTEFPIFIRDELQSRCNYDPKLTKNFTKKWIVFHALFLKNYFKIFKISNNLDEVLPLVLSFRWMLYYKFICFCWWLESSKSKIRNLIA